MAPQQSLLAEVGTLLHDYFALSEWGRLLIEVEPNEQGQLSVGELFVDEIVGDEARVEQAFGSDEARALVPALAQAVATMVAAEGADLALVRGGTWLRRGEGAEIAFLPGLVRAPSRELDQCWEDVLARTREGLAKLDRDFGFGAGVSVETDMLLGTVRFVRAGQLVAEGQQIVLGSFSLPHRSWVWGAHNPTLAPEARARARELLDAMPQRAAWEISTPGFACDAATAWALGAWVVHSAGVMGPLRVDAGSGSFVLLGVRDLRRADGG